jgi:hypothetical protein
MRTLFLLTLTTLAAAATGCMSDMKSPDKNFTYDCSGLGKGWGDCTQKADAQCGANNYAVVSRTGEAEEKPSSGNTEMKRTLMVTCKH